MNNKEVKDVEEAFQKLESKKETIKREAIILASRVHLNKAQNDKSIKKNNSLHSDTN